MAALTPALLIAWLDKAADDYDVGPENNPASRVLDAIKSSLIAHLYGPDFKSGYLFEHLDAAIDALRENGGR